MTPSPYSYTASITSVISEALCSRNVSEIDCLIFDDEEKKFSVGPIGISNGHNRRGFEIGFFVDFDDDCPFVDDDAVNLFSQMLADGLLDT